MTDSLADLAARCAVALYSGRQFLGSGFLVAPGQVLTCAHVVAECGRELLTVRWAGGEFTETSGAPRPLIPPQRGPGLTYASPDLALIAVDLQPDQPFVWLADQAPGMASTVVCFGYSEHTPEAGAALDPVLLQVPAASGEFVRVQQGEISRGMSGGLALDLDTRRVCGMVKVSRDPQAPRGGWIIPVSVIAAHLGETVQKNMAGHGPTSAWRQVATRHAEFAQRLFGSRSPLQVPDPPRNPPPSWWLDPRHRITRFQERPELEALLAWAVDVDPATAVVKLVIGEGGSGKTRLAVELAARLGARGWIAGELTATPKRLAAITKALPDILACRHQVFIAIDYPEGLGDDLTEFLDSIPEPAHGPEPGIVRVLLLARFGGGWWDGIHPSGEIRYLIDRNPVQLAPLGSDPDVAVGRFSEAVQDYRLSILGPGTGPAARPAVPAGLAQAAGRHVTAIKLHALALASVLYERDEGVLPAEEVIWTDPLSMLVSHEREHWRKAAYGTLSLTRGEPLEGRILLAPTLLPVYRAGDAAAAVSRIPRLAERYPGRSPDIAALLRDLYPPNGTSSLRWWSPLPLDRLSETLLAQVLTNSSDGQSADEYVVALLGAVDLPQAVQGLTIMARLNADPQTSGDLAATISRCLDTLATAGRSRLLPALLLADRQVAPGLRTSERYLATLDVVGILTLVENMLGLSGHRLLQEIGLVLLDQADRILDPDEMRTAALPEELRGIVPGMRARGIKVPMGTLSHVYVEVMRARLLLPLGRAGEALGLAESAARSMRAIFRASSAQGRASRLLIDDKILVHATGPSDQSGPLLLALDVYAQALKAVGRLQESADVRRECAAVADQMAASADPDVKRTAAIHFYQLAEILLELGQADQAESWARRAVQLAPALPVSLLMAEALTLWARTLDRAGKPVDARAIAADALRLHWEVAGQTGSRTHLAVAMQALEHLAPQPDSQLDPVTELREEVLRDPAFVIPVFVAAAAQRAERLAGQGQVEEARLQMAEALAQARRLAADDPDTYLEVVAALLMRCAYRGLCDDPAGALTEAVAIFRRLVDQHGRDDLRTGLALSLQQHSLLLRSSGRDADALHGFAEAIGLLRPLLAHDRWQTAVHLSTILGLFSETASKHGDPEQAVASAREAIDLEVARTDDLTPAPAERLLQLRHMLFVALVRVMGSRVEQGADPAVIAAMATEICGLARSLPASTLDVDDITIFASTLTMIGTFLRDSERLEEALSPLTEAITILRDHADSDPAGRNTGLLLQIGATQVAAYRALERHAEAAGAMIEVLTDCRRPLHGEQEERLHCLVLAGAVMDQLPGPAFAAQRLQIVVEMSRTCRELPADLAEGHGGAAASAVLICRFLKEAASNGLLGDSGKAAALEISAGIQFLTEHAPRLLGAEHAKALTLAASILVASDPDHALDLNTRAIELHQNLAADRDSDNRPEVGSLVLQGLILSGKHRYDDAVQPLEQALPILLAAGPGISADQVRLLNMTLSLLSEAYRILQRDSAMQALINAVRAAGVPAAVPDDRSVRTPATDLIAALQAAVNAADADPERGITALQEVLDATTERRDYLTARAASHYLARALLRTGRLPEALRSADLKIAYGYQANLGPWTQLRDKSERLQLWVQAGLDNQTILTEATGLIAAAEELPSESADRESIDPDWVRESLLRSSASAAARLHQWPDALRFIQAEVRSLRDRGAPPADIADAEFNAFNALAGMDRISEARELLDRCETAFRQEGSSQDLHLGLIPQARAYLAALTGDPALAVGLQSEALERLYRLGDVTQIQGAHANFGQWLEEADRFSARGLAHDLAAAVLAELLGQAADIRAISSRLLGRAGDCPATPALLCAVVEETPGVHLAELLGQLSRDATAAPGSILSHLLRQARNMQRPAFDEFARHRMEWDPVFAGIVAARQGDVASARAVAQRLPIYAEDRSWSQFSRALGLILHQRPEAAAAMSLDIIDQILLHRCQDALDGNVRIPPELAQAIPIAGELSRLLSAVQNNEPSSALARTLEKLAEHEQWHPLLTPLRRILAGDRDPEMTAGLTPANAVIISALLGHVAAP